jgi:protoheme IX farnesyltransferase
VAVYLFIYTPLKRRTSLCTVIGAVSGAAPPLIGWAPARGSLTFEAWVLYVMVFLWQFPHVMAIAWMYSGVRGSESFLQEKPALVTCSRRPPGRSF